MSMWSRLSRGETTFDFVGLRRRWFTISSVLIVASLLALGVRGLDLGLEFEGGVLVHMPNPAAAELGEIRDTVDELGLNDARIQLVDEGEAVRVQTGPLNPDRQELLVADLIQVTGAERGAVSLEAVGPTFGELVARQALIALGVFLGAAALFITWRLQWKMAGAGLVALFHDLILTVGVYAATGFQVTPATVVAILTILGYSLYDTVVVFDKVQELERDLGDRMTYTQIVNRSMNQVLVRSIATSLTSLFPIGSLLFVGAILLGASSLQDFALALFVGIGAGTYSSVFVAGPLLAAWREREPVWQEQRERLERRAEVRGEPLPEEQPVPEPAPSAPAAGRPPRAPKPGAGAAPRPPKRRKR